MPHVSDFTLISVNDIAVIDPIRCGIVSAFKAPPCRGLTVLNQLNNIGKSDNYWTFKQILG
jgi:hypothetical protein